MEYFAKKFFQRSLDLYFQRSLDLHDPAHRAIFEVMVDTDVESTLDPATRQWMLMPRAKHISSKFCRNLEYVQHLLEAGTDDQLRLLFFKPINVDNLYQRRKYKPTNSCKHKTVQDVYCQTDAVSYANGTCQTQICTSEAACLTELYLEERESQTAVYTTDTGSQIAISTGDFATQTEIDIKEIACQTQIVAKDTGIQTAVSTDDCSIQPVIAAQEIACRTEIYNDEAASQKANGIKTAQTNTGACINNQQPECLRSDTAKQLAADEKIEGRKVYNSVEFRQNDYKGRIPDSLFIYGECDAGGGGDSKNSGQEDGLKSYASTNLFSGSYGFSYERHRACLYLGLEQTECLRHVEVPNTSKSGVCSVLTGESTESVAKEILSLDGCSRRSPSVVVASEHSVESCSSLMSYRSIYKSPQIAAPEVAAPTSVLPAVPEIPAEQLAVKYTLGKSKIVLGAGTYGTVYLVSHIPTNTTVVCKQLYLATSPYDSILREASIQLYLHPTNRVPYVYGMSTTFGEAGTACIFQQYHNNCPTVEDLLKLPAGYIAKKEWVELAFDICAGLADIHEMGVLHNDIKANNLIVVTETSPYQVKYIDFGLASDMNGLTYNSKPADAHRYPHLAPETFYSLPTTVKSDVYSAGYVLKLINEIVQSPLINSMTDRCFKEDPDGRPSLTNIMAALNYTITSIFFI